MSTTPNRSPGGWLKELKTNRKTQAGLAAFLVAILFMVWTLAGDKPKNRPRTTGALSHSLSSPSALPDPQRRELERFARLADLGQAKELPDEDRVYRDPFLFDAPPPKPAPAPVAPPPPPQPTEAELKARRDKEARDAEWSGRPQSLRYLGYLERGSVGRIGAFMRGEDALTYKVGDMPSPKWKLVSLTETYAEFQNTTHSDMRHRLEAVDGGPAPRSGGFSNQY